MHVSSRPFTFLTMVMVLLYDAASTHSNSRLRIIFCEGLGDRTLFRARTRDVTVTHCRMRQGECVVWPRGRGKLNQKRCRASWRELASPTVGAVWPAGMAVWQSCHFVRMSDGRDGLDCLGPGPAWLGSLGKNCPGVRAQGSRGSRVGSAGSRAGTWMSDPGAKMWRVQGAVVDP